MLTEYGEKYNIDKHCDIELYDENGNPTYLTENDVLEMLDKIQECKSYRDSRECR